MARFSPIEVLDGVWWVGVVSLLVSLLATPIARLVAYKAGVLDKPDELLKPHQRPIAYLGGLAICAGLLLGLLAYALTMGDTAAQWSAIRSDLAGMRLRSLAHNRLWHLIAIGAACLLITVMGLLDDLKNLKPRHKIYGQILAGVG